MRIMQIIRFLLSLAVSVAFGLFLYTDYTNSTWLLWKRLLLCVGYSLLAFGLSLDLAGFFRNWNSRSN
jgi:hypothetical protein